MIKKIYSLLLVGIISCSFFGCGGTLNNSSNNIQEVDVCGQQVELLKDSDNEVVIEISNCISQNDGHEYPVSYKTLNGNPDVIESKAKSTYEENKKVFPDCVLKVLSVNNKQLEDQYLSGYEHLGIKLNFDLDIIKPFIYILVACVILSILCCIFIWYQQKKVRDTIQRLAAGVEELTVKEFFKMREVRSGKQKLLIRRTLLEYTF